MMAPEVNGVHAPADALDLAVPIVRRTRSNSGALYQSTVPASADVPALAAPIVRRTRSNSSATLSKSAGTFQSAPAASPSVMATSVLLPPDTECALYWDYENMPLGKLLCADTLSHLISCVRNFGRVVESRLYADSGKQWKGASAPRQRALLERLGITLIDCPTEDKREAVDKKIICDAVVWAVSRASRSLPCSVVLVSGDGDFAYMLSRLRSLGVRIIVIGCSSVLRDVSDTALTLSEVCGIRDSSSDSSSKLAGGGRRGCGSGSAIHGASVDGENKCDETIGDSPCANNRSENPTSGISSASGRARKRKRAEAAISGLSSRGNQHKYTRGVSGRVATDLVANTLGQSATAQFRGSTLATSNGARGVSSTSRKLAGIKTAVSTGVFGVAAGGRQAMRHAGLKRAKLSREVAVRTKFTTKPKRKPRHVTPKAKHKP